MTEEASNEFILREIDETRGYLLHEIKHFWCCFHFCICFISLFSCWYYELCNRNKNLELKSISQ